MLLLGAVADRHGLPFNRRTASPGDGRGGLPSMHALVRRMGIGRTVGRTGANAEDLLNALWMTLISKFGYLNIYLLVFC